MNIQEPFVQKNKKSKKTKKEPLINSKKSEAEIKLRNYTIDSNTKINITTFIISLIVIFTIVILTIANSDFVKSDDSIRIKFAAGMGIIGLIMLIVAFSMASKINNNKYKDDDLANAKMYIFIEKMIAPAYLIYIGIFMKRELLDWFREFNIVNYYFNIDNYKDSFKNISITAITLFYIFMMIIVWLN